MSISPVSPDEECSAETTGESVLPVDPYFVDLSQVENGDWSVAADADCWGDCIAGGWGGVEDMAGQGGWGKAGR